MPAHTHSHVLALVEVWRHGASWRRQRQRQLLVPAGPPQVHGQQQVLVLLQQSGVVVLLVQLLGEQQLLPGLLRWHERRRRRAEAVRAAGAAELGVLLHVPLWAHRLWRPCRLVAFPPPLPVQKGRSG